MQTFYDVPYITGSFFLHQDNFKLIAATRLNGCVCAVNGMETPGEMIYRALPFAMS